MRSNIKAARPNFKYVKCKPRLHDWFFRPVQKTRFPGLLACFQKVKAYVWSAQVMDACMQRPNPLVILWFVSFDNRLFFALKGMDFLILREFLIILQLRSSLPCDCIIPVFWCSSLSIRGENPLKNGDKSHSLSNYHGFLADNDAQTWFRLYLMSSLFGPAQHQTHHTIQR